MLFSTTDELAAELLRLRLINSDQLSESQAHFPITSDPESLLKALEAQHLLTSYQASKLRIDEKSPLVLGDIKLMYQNASGSFARVFRGCSISTGETIGVKVLRQRFLDDPASVAQFHREAELCMKLRHKNIVPIFEPKIDDGFHYFTMEFVEGGNLKDFSKIRGKLKPDELLRCACDITEGLEYALRQGMTHRDLKLSNILMSSRGVAKLVDFGLAGDDSDEDDENVHAVEYATLEKNTRAPSNDPRSDLFFLGTILYELASGKPPYPASSQRETRKQFSRYSGIMPVRRADPNVPVQISEIIDRLLRVNPVERYQSATELLGDLRPALAKFAPNLVQPASDTHQAPRLSTILVVEYRVKQQDMLRDYLTKHGFRVLMLSTWDRALTRIKNNPPDGVIVMGDALEKDGPAVYDEAIRWCENKGVGCVLVLASSQRELAEKLRVRNTTRVVVQPVQLRTVRTSITETLQAHFNRN
jgi:eukaryotic-like serine/threonine-protein kinase